MPSRSKKANNNFSSPTLTALDETKQDTPTQVSTEPLAQTMHNPPQPSLADIMNALLGLTARIDKLEQKQVDADVKTNQLNAVNSNDFQTPIKNINAINTPPSLVFENSNNTHSTIVNQINNSADPVMKMHNIAKSTSNKDLVDKDLHPILNTKLELDVNTAPKLSRSLSADEYINWYNKLRDIVLSNPRFMFLFNNSAENAWKICGGELWTRKLSSNDLDLYRWESSFINSSRYLFTFISQLVPEDIVHAIRLHMIKDRGKYNIASRLGFRSNVVLQLNCSSEPFYQDVFEFMQLLEKRYNTKDCNRVMELVKAFNAIKLDELEHPQTIFMKYQEVINRIKAVYPQYQEQSESWMCFDILTRLPRMYNHAVKELFRLDLHSLKKEDVLKRLVAEYSHNNTEHQMQEGESTTNYSVELEKQHNVLVALKGSATRVCYNCGKQGHMIRNCPTAKKAQGEKGESYVVVNNGDGTVNCIPCEPEYIEESSFAEIENNHLEQTTIN
jgi:hypothetical protein